MDRISGSLRATSGALAVGALILACTTALRPAGPAGLPGDAPRIVLGTFDSRALAIAYVNSEPFRARLQALHAELEEARAAGDVVRVAELEALGPALQERVHRQGFSTAPVDDILEILRDELPALATQAGVDVLVSRWNLVYQAPGARTVDVTEALVRALHPDERGLGWALGIMDQPPVPAEQLGHDR